MTPYEYVALEGMCRNGVWDWNVKQSIVKPQTYGQNNIFSEKPTLLHRTAELAKRIFTGVVGAGLSFGAAFAIEYYLTTKVPGHLVEKGIFAAGLGVASAHLTKDPAEALVRAMQLSTVASATIGICKNLPAIDQISKQACTYMKDSFQKLPTPSQMKSQFFEALSEVKNACCGSSATPS